MSDRKQRARAHARHAYFCKCGRVVHGNGARAMHFYVGGQRDAGRREGHGEVSRGWYLDNIGLPLEQECNR